MTLNVFSFYVFLVVFLSTCFLTPYKYRKGLLLFANLIVLFSLSYKVALLYIILSLINFYVGSLYLKKKYGLAFLIILNFYFLLFFKYLIETLDLSWGAEFIVPVGISFFVFGQISFLVDRKHNIKLQNLSVCDFLRYTFLFPSFSSGPVIRMEKVLENDKGIMTFNSYRTNEGLLLIFSGLFKKFCVADNISNFTSVLYNPSLRLEGVDYFVPFVLSKYEIFANFSGYTDIALGIGIILGFYLPENFNRPFSVLSVVDFWKRWHMSLTEWIRHYVFYPLALSRFGKLGPYALMLATFLVFAFWHGIKANYILYALIQVGLIFLGHKSAPYYLKLEEMIPSLFLKNVFKFVRWIYFYLIVISIPGVLFRVETIAEFTNVLKLVSDSSYKGIISFFNTSAHSLFYAIAGIILIEFCAHFSIIKRLSLAMQKMNWLWKMLIFYILILVLLIAYNKELNSSFIYSIF